MLVPGAVLGAFGDRPQVPATVFDPLQVRPLDPFALSNMFGLTPAEARVAARLGEGLTAGAVAAEHGTARSTVRTQIRRVIYKLGARRQTSCACCAKATCCGRRPARRARRIDALVRS